MAMAVALTWVVFTCPTDAGNASREDRGSFHRHCAICHHPDLPYDLAGVFNERAGSRPGHFYSEAMLKAGADGLIWTPQNLDAFIAKPKTFLPGTTMGAFPGLKDPQARADVIAYLKTLSAAPGSH